MHCHHAELAQPKSEHSIQPLLIDVKAAAAMLDISTRLLWTLTKCHAIPVRRIGRAVRYAPDELRAWVAAGCPATPGSADRVRAAVRRGDR